MRVAQRARLLRIHCAESDRFERKPLHEAIVDKCRELGVAGVTVFAGVEGYGETAGMHRVHLLVRDQPVVLAIVDSAESVARVIAAVEPMLHTGLLAVSDVEVIRVEKDRA